MKKIITSLLFGTILCIVPACGQSEKNELDATQKAFIVSRFCTEVKYNFVHYNNLTYNWDSLCITSLPSLTATQSDEDFINGLKQLCAQLHDGHTFIYQTKWSKNSKEWLRPFPITTKRVGNQVFVTSVHNSEFKKQGVSYGCEILEIDGENVLEYADKHITPYLASSTPQWSDHAPFRGYELTNAKGTKVSRMLLRTPEGRTFTIESDRNIPWDIPADSSVFEYKVLEGNIGLLSVKSFLTEDFHRDEFDKIYEEILKTNALIIDIRDNGGGNSDHADYIIRHFDDKPVRLGRWSSRMYIAAHGSWDYPQEWFTESPDPMEPVKDKPIYKKPIALLVNATTFSSAENFCVTYRGLNRGKIIGTPTGGSTGNPIFIDLGFGLGCSICTKNEWDVDDREFIGIGIVPDIEVKENTDMFLKNKDVVIEKALEVLKDSL
ncbi:S41 family peptidase [Parabacteroides faecis]|uniref:S41 family peptidase n=1 Tax=Parabacteroides faecis TaxID=1217282 RepID=UPI0021642D3F|nr:S41 family peptidase [Parabacteroides faecis]MCS2892201.1 S41 family peptidase [Parabacteroides faecis]UVQ49159.1 S41 family peptidase [Parabacteroides faecis]